MSLRLRKKRVLQLICDIHGQMNINNSLSMTRTPIRYTRIHQRPTIQLPNPENEALKRRPLYYGCNIWKNIPADCRNEDDMEVFKNNVKIMLKINVIEI